LIESVRIVPLKKVVNERGHLMEVQRDDDALCRGCGQVYVTATLPGIVKAWYRHHKQVDQIAVIKGDFLLVLFDGREESPTRGELDEIAMTEQAPLLVEIPTGIWHGFKARGDETGYLLHLNSTAVDVNATDEDRLPPDSATIPYKW
jgi:dTDP-4-dehydrorhamnose 3,5-epimerase